MLLFVKIILYISSYRIDVSLLFNLKSIEKYHFSNKINLTVILKPMSCTLDLEGSTPIKQSCIGAITVLVPTAHTEGVSK